MKRAFAEYRMADNKAISIVEWNDEYVCYLDTIGGWHRAKIYANSKRAYFNCCEGFRVYLDECVAI